MPELDPNARTIGLARYLPVAAIVVALTAFFLFDLDRYFTMETLRDNRDALDAWVSARPLLSLGLFVIVYAGSVAISFPGASILTVFGGFLFGLWPGVPAIVVAATLGALCVFFASKTALGGALRRSAGGFVAGMEKGFRDNELSYMFVLRLAPVFPFWAVNMAAGLLGVSFRNFLIGTVAGIVPGTFVYASIGNAAGAAFDAGENVSLAGILLQPETLLPLIGLIALALLPVFVRKLRKSGDGA